MFGEIDEVFFLQSLKQMCNFECSCVCLPTLQVSYYYSYEQGGHFVAVVKLAGVFES